MYSTFVGTAPVEQAARLFTNYTVWHTPEKEEKPTQLELEVQYVPLPEDEPQEVVQEVFAEEAPVVEEPVVEEQSAFEWWMVAVAAGVFLLGGGTVLGLLRHARKKQERE